MKLNDNQQTAVQHKDGPMLVVAGAGTGKTRVIIERITKLIADGVATSSILALTFTEKAAQEMLDRAAETIEGSYGAELNIFTFNGFGSETLREFAPEIGRSPSLKLVGDLGKVVVLREHLDQLGLDYFAPVSRPDGQLSAIADYFSQLKQQLVTPTSYHQAIKSLPKSDEADQLEIKKHSELATAYEAYLDITRRNNIIDYDDQIYLLVELLEKRPNIKKKLQQRYQYLLVDEFQDTNPMQARLLELLAGEQKNIMAVGDDDQSIYGWRGATLANILTFKDSYEAEQVTLTQNYRSTQEILDASYKLIQNNNPDRLEVINKLDKKLTAEKGSGIAPICKSFGHIDTELDWVARDIERKLEEGVEPGSIAVLARRSSETKRMHQALERIGVEHSVAGNTVSLYDQPIVEAMVQALKAVTDQHNLTAIHQTLTGPLFECDAATVGSIMRASQKTFTPLEDIIAGRDDDMAAITQALEKLAEWRDHAPRISVGSLSYMMIDESGLKDKVVSNAESSTEDYLTAQALFQWFATLRSFQDVSELSTALSYLESFDTLRAEGEVLEQDSELMNTELPIIMTVHKAKGLEWDHVYIIDCAERSFPLQRRGKGLEIPESLKKTSKADDHYEEERRLMYVAATRAKKELILTYANNKGGARDTKPSRFIDELISEQNVSASNDEQVKLDLFEQPSTPSKQPTIPASFFSGENLVLTASQANDFLKCALDFKYRYFLGVPAEANSQASIGTLFHDLMQQLNLAKQQGKTPLSEEEMIKRITQDWPQEGYLSKKQRERALAFAIESCATLHQRIINEPVPVAVEQPFRLHIPEAKLIIKGRIDVVMPFEDGVDIRDYKTSTATDTVKKATARARGSKQLEIYALAWLKLHGEYPKKVSLDFVQTGAIGQVGKQEKTIDKMQDKLSEMADSIRRGDFEPGRQHDFCRHPKLT